MYRRSECSVCVCVCVRQGGREIGRSSLVEGKWADLFFGSFPAKLPGDRDTENIRLYTNYVLHKELVNQRDGAHEDRSACVLETEWWAGLNATLLAS